MDYTWALNQKAVYWERLGPDGYGGFLWEDPVEIDCRWKLKSQLIVTPAGEEIVSNAEVLVNQEMKVGDFIYLGDLDDITSASGSPASMSEAFEIKRFDQVPDIEGTEFTRRAWL